ncbi:MAG TPA: Nif3-like dinuclear metal center hexameric protein [Bryobacteraceae bacterium]|nr:Nif3-like dinuclear metal center hexameric protein [Bryobacteraceae bacterium]
MAELNTHQVMDTVSLGLSRRTLVTGVTMSTGVGFAQDPQLTARQVLDRIKTNVGVPWRQQTVDNIIAGTADTPVKGIATTMMATLDVIQRASAAGLNMVVTHESTFFSHQDTVAGLQMDETYRYKLDFLDRNGMVVFHFHDHWHARRPDGIAAGMSRELGWDKNADPDNPRLFSFPGVPLARLSRDIQSKLQIRTMRVLGDPKLAVRRAIASWGYASQIPAMRLISRPDVDALVVGETREWELVEYVQDMIASGQKKALLVLGHVVSEQAGMKLCAEWLKPFVPEVPIQFIAASEPFWLPDHPGA